MLCFLLLDMVHSVVFVCVCVCVCMCVRTCVHERERQTDRSVKPVLCKVDLFLSVVVIYSISGRSAQVSYGDGWFLHMTQ
jgi:hypothetical protein